MKVTRLDLDGTGSPHGLVTLILKAEPTLPIPVPVEELARQLDIEKIQELETDGFEGGLITDDCRSRGIILVSVNTQRQRKRFTIGHELGHFLIPTHRPRQVGRFLCSREDMQRWPIKDQNTYARMEAEANTFSALLLMPPPTLRRFMEKLGDPSLENVISVARHFDVSKDAAARAYAEYNDHRVAIVVVKDNKVLRAYKGPKFPRVCVPFGGTVPNRSVFHRTTASARVSNLEALPAEIWLESEWGTRLPDLYEQVMIQQEGYALLLLWAEIADVDEEGVNDERTAKERLRDRQARRQW